MHPISSQDENDSLSSTEEVSQLSTSTSRGAMVNNVNFPSELACTRFLKMLLMLILLSLINLGNNTLNQAVD